LVNEAGIKADETYYKDKSKFEENHIKIIHPPLYLTIKETDILMQSEGEIIQSYKHLKSLIGTEKGLNKTSLLNLGLMMNI